MYGSRSREVMRQAVRRSERSSANAVEHAKRSYAGMCTKRKLIPQMQEKLESLRKRMKTCKGPSQIHMYLGLKEQTELIGAEIKEIQSGREARAFFERARPLMVQEHKVDDVNMAQKREALAMSLFHPEKAVPVFVQTDRCTHCHHDLRIRSDESLTVCPGCRRTCRFLQLSTDHVDVDYVAQDTHANHTRSTCTGNVDNMSNSDNPYPKPPLFLKFLMQFFEDIPDPPSKVIETILHELSKVHIHHTTKVQSTPIGNILRKTNLKEWSWMALRIAMMLKRRSHEPMPVFSQALISRLMKRFEKLVDALMKSRCRNRKKVFNFKFITKVFLVMENEFSLAELFENHRTRSVIRREDKRVGDTCRILQEEMKENSFTWAFFRSL
jgi:hypothetical protein